MKSEVPCVVVGRPKRVQLQTASKKHYDKDYDGPITTMGFEKARP